MDSPIGAPPARPWTPPDTDTASSPRSDCFSDPFRASADTEQAWSNPPAMEPSSASSPRCDTPTEDHQPSRPKPISHLTCPTPYTPTKTFSLQSTTHANGAPQYPYTPDSSRILRRSTELPSSPSPWDEYADDVTSPIQSALSSCIIQVENLIQTREPDEDQMEYIVGQFEAMASFLAAPDAQSKTTDDHLFVEQAHGLGIRDAQNVDAGSSATSEALDPSYVAQVGRYIQGVQKHIEDLKMRLDEAKTLNSIQLDVIDDLRRQIKSVRLGLQTELPTDHQTFPPQRAFSPFVDDNEDDYESIDDDEDIDGETKDPFVHSSWETIDAVVPSSPPQPESCGSSAFDALSAPPPKYKRITIIRKPQRRSFWASFAQAVDEFGSLLLED